jgi:hypothetical protein
VKHFVLQIWHETCQVSCFDSSFKVNRARPISCLQYVIWHDPIAESIWRESFATSASRAMSDEVISLMIPASSADLVSQKELEAEE